MTSLEAPLGPFQEEPICLNTSGPFLARDTTLSGYIVGIPFATGEDPMRVAKAITAELSFAGIQGQHMVLRMDNQNTLQSLWNKAARDRMFPGLSLHIDSVAKGRPQQKGQVEVGVRFAVQVSGIKGVPEGKLHLSMQR